MQRNSGQEAGWQFNISPFSSCGLWCVFMRLVALQKADHVKLVNEVTWRERNAVRTMPTRPFLRDGNAGGKCEQTRVARVKAFCVNIAMQHERYPFLCYMNSFDNVNNRSYSVQQRRTSNLYQPLWQPKVCKCQSYEWSHVRTKECGTHATWRFRMTS